MAKARWCPMVRGISRLEAPSGTRPRWMNGVEKVAVVAGEHVVAMEQHGGADADRDAVDGGDDRLDVVGERIEKLGRVVGARGASVLEVPSFRKSSRSLPAVNTPEPPVMIRQRISGLFCAVSIASLMARYMSWVIAFFFSGRRSVITRVASSSVTIRWPVMMRPGIQRQSCRWRVFAAYPTSSPTAPQTGRRRFSTVAE